MTDPQDSLLGSALALARATGSERVLDTLSDNALCAMPWLFDIWAHPHQIPPSGDWKTWICMGGRGAGKTRAGAEWVRAVVEGATPLACGIARRVALVAETADQAAGVMVHGESGILRVSPPDRRPEFHISRRRLVWPNGAEAHLFSAKDPESLRGPQFNAAWCDEFGKWRRAGAAWDMLQFGLRLGDHPRCVVTTTPRRNKTLQVLIDDPTSVLTCAPTHANAAYLAPGFLEQITRRYGGTSLGRQEIEGEMLVDLPGALWNRAILDANRLKRAPSLTRIVVAVDPPVSARSTSDSCGIIVAGVSQEGASEDWTACVLADHSVQGRSPRAWAERVVAAYRQHKADRIIAEVNQGGDMVETILRQVDPNVPVKSVYATRGKRVRAEPVAALYEQGRVRHMGPLKELEDQMCAFAAAGYRGDTRSPDRVDALVWAITELLLTAPDLAPQLREL